jgi:hypothetical protein
MSKKKFLQLAPKPAPAPVQAPEPPKIPHILVALSADELALISTGLREFREGTIVTLMRNTNMKGELEALSFNTLNLQYKLKPYLVKLSEAKAGEV